MITINFLYTNEFGETTTLVNEYTNAILLDQSEFEFLIDEFKKFLYASGFDGNIINTLQIVED